MKEFPFTISSIDFPFSIVFICMVEKLNIEVEFIRGGFWVEEERKKRRGKRREMGVCLRMCISSFLKKKFVSSLIRALQDLRQLISLAFGLKTKF